jgi:hypothetical protein
MTPEELAAYREWVRIMEFKRNSWPCMALDHIDQQAARIAELDDAVSGPLENITKMLETVNEDMIFSGIIQTWKTENDTLKTRIAELEIQVAALQEIAITEKAYHIYYRCQGDCGRCVCSAGAHKKDARRQLAEEHPEAFR